MMTKQKTKQEAVKQKHKDFPGNLLQINFLEKEIEYAKSQLEPHDTGHIHTAISWMDHRVKQLKGIYDE